MPRRLIPMAKAWGHCTYRRKCNGTAAFFYEVPSLTRSHNISTRTKSVCPECADIIRKVYTVVEEKS